MNAPVKPLSSAEVDDLLSTLTTKPTAPSSPAAPITTAAHRPEPAPPSAPSPDTPTPPGLTAAVIAEPRVQLRPMLEAMDAAKASDLILVAGSAPKFRVNGVMSSVPASAVLSPAQIVAMIDELLTEDQRRRFGADSELDLSFGIAGLSRFRANVYMQRGTLALAVRQVPFAIPPLESLGLPPIVGTLAGLSRGLVLVTGAAGSGKSTTLAAIIAKINADREAHIISIEDPIEFVHPHDRSIVSQREIGADTRTFASALRHVLRQSPDVICVGEMRDLETMAAAITVAETGHLTLGTLHTNSAAEAVNRMVDVFPGSQQPQIRAQLAIALQAVVTQVLLARADGKGRVCACEVMIATTAVRTMIRENRAHQLTAVMENSREAGMQTLNTALVELVKHGTVTPEECFKHTNNRERLDSLLGDLHQAPVK